MPNVDDIIRESKKKKMQEQLDELIRIQDVILSEIKDIAYRLKGLQEIQIKPNPPEESPEEISKQVLKRRRIPKAGGNPE